MKAYQWIRAGHTHNGNPRRCFVVYEITPKRGAVVSEVIDEGYRGKPRHLWGMAQLCDIETTATEYREFLKLGQELEAEAKKKGG